MQIDRQMLGLFFEIKRSLPLNTREKLKISDSNVCKKLVVLHNHSDDDHLKEVIERFLTFSCEEWLKQITPLEKYSNDDNKERIRQKILTNNKVTKLVS